MRAVGDLLHRGQYRVDLRGPDPHAVPVEGGVRAAEHETAAAGVDAEEVTLAPDPGEVREIRLAVPGAIRVPPEADRHRRHRLGDDELAHLIDDLLAALIERVRRHAEVASLDLAGVDGKRRHAPDEPGADVRAAAARAQPQVGP